MSIPNLITLGRILLVPVVVWAIMSNAMWFAFMLFLAAGVSDGVSAIPTRLGIRQYLLILGRCGRKGIHFGATELTGRPMNRVQHDDKSMMLPPRHFCLASFG